MLRIHFTTEDLIRTRLADTWGPLGETMLSLTSLRAHSAPGLFGGWRERTRRATPLSTHPFSALFDDALLDLFTLTGAADTVEEGLEGVLGADSHRLQTEWEGAEQARSNYTECKGRWPGALLGDFAHDRADRRALVRFLSDYHRTAVAPHWPRVYARLQAEQTERARTIATHGVHGLLAGLPPGYRWRPPVLTIGRGAPVHDMTLGGRGLVLVPSVFTSAGTAVYTDPTDEQKPSIAFFPVLHDAADAARTLTGPEPGGSHKTLSALLGRTRACALDAIGTSPCTTGQLAERLVVSPATASEHASVLRGAGLITTTRHGSTVVHAPTPLGTALLNGAHGESGPAVPGGSSPWSARAGGPAH